jgi:hypothetical protein
MERLHKLLNAPLLFFLLFGPTVSGEWAALGWFAGLLWFGRLDPLSIGLRWRVRREILAAMAGEGWTVRGLWLRLRSPAGGPRITARLRWRGGRIWLQVKVEGLDPRLMLRPRRVAGEGGEATGDAGFDGQIVTQGGPALERITPSVRESLRRLLLRDSDRLEGGRLTVSIPLGSAKPDYSLMASPDKHAAALFETAEAGRVARARTVWEARETLGDLQALVGQLQAPAEEALAPRGPRLARLLQRQRWMSSVPVVRRRRARTAFLACLSLGGVYSAWILDDPLALVALISLSFLALLLLALRRGGRSHLSRVATFRSALEFASIEPLPFGLGQSLPAAAGTFGGRLVRVQLLEEVLRVEMVGVDPALSLELVRPVKASAFPLGDPGFDHWLAATDRRRGAREVALATLDSQAREILVVSGCNLVRLEGGELRLEIPLSAPSERRMRLALEHAAALVALLEEGCLAVSSPREALLLRARTDPCEGVRFRALDALLRRGGAGVEREELGELSAPFGDGLHLAAVAGGLAAPDAAVLRRLLAGGQLEPDERREARALLGKLHPEADGGLALAETAGERGAISEVAANRGAISAITERGS